MMFDVFETPYDTTPEEDGAAPELLVGIDDLRLPDVSVLLDGISADPMDLLVSKMTEDPTLRAVAALLEAAQDLKEAATDLLGEDLGEEKMASFDDLDDLADALADAVKSLAEAANGTNERPTGDTDPPGTSLKQIIDLLNLAQEMKEAATGELGSDLGGDENPVIYFASKEDYGFGADVFDFAPFAELVAGDDDDWPSLKN